MSTLRIAAVQFSLGEGATSAEFLRKVTETVVQAKNNGAEMVVFPELITLELVDWASPVDHRVQLQNVATGFTDAYIQSLRALSREHRINILGGTAPRIVNGKIRNTAIMTLAHGEVILQDKLYLTPDEKAWGWEPGDTLNVFQTPWGRSVIAICFDSEFPEISQRLANSNPEIFFVPSWTSTERGFNRVDWATKGRAIEHYAYVVKTATVPNANSAEPHFGNATILAPQDAGFQFVAIEGPREQETIIYGDLDFDILRTRRAATGYSPVKEQGIRQTPIILNVENEQGQIVNRRVVRP